MTAPKHTPGPITIEEVTGGYLLKAESVGKGYYSSIGHATQRNPHPHDGGGVSIETARANAQLWSVSAEMLEQLTGLHVAVRDNDMCSCDSGSPCRAARLIAKAAGSAS